MSYSCGLDYDQDGSIPRRCLFSCSNDEVSMCQLLATLKDISSHQHSIETRLKNLPELILNIHDINHPYLFIIIK